MRPPSPSPPQIVPLSNAAGHLGWPKSRLRAALQASRAPVITQQGGVIEYALLTDLRRLFPGAFLAPTTQHEEVLAWRLAQPIAADEGLN